jgi:hypothetical protein
MLRTPSQLEPRVLTALLVGASLGLGATAHADEGARAAPPAPINTQTAPQEPAPATPDPNSAASPAAQVERPSVAELNPQTSVAVPPEPTFRAETRRLTWPNVPLLATGATVFGASYLPAVVGAAVTDRNDKLYVPVAGPWLTLGRGPEQKAGHKALLAVDGVTQGLGALMLVSSFLVPERVTEHWYLIGRLQVVPGKVGKGFGLAARARF